eukprot:350556-Chlamydomonas_euryale.AAC.15
MFNKHHSAMHGPPRLAEGGGWQGRRQHRFQQPGLRMLSSGLVSTCTCAAWGLHLPPPAHAHALPGACTSHPQRMHMRCPGSAPPSRTHVCFLYRTGGRCGCSAAAAGAAAPWLALCVSTTTATMLLQGTESDSATSVHDASRSPTVPAEASAPNRPYQAVGGVPTVLGGVADGSRFRRPSRGGRATCCASGEGRATGRATRASDRGPGPAIVWRPVQDGRAAPDPSATVTRPGRERSCALRTSAARTRLLSGADASM